MFNRLVRPLGPELPPGTLCGLILGDPIRLAFVADALLYLLEVLAGRGLLMRQLAPGAPSELTHDYIVGTSVNGFVPSQPQAEGPRRPWRPAGHGVDGVLEDLALPACHGGMVEVDDDLVPEGKAALTWHAYIDESGDRGWKYRPATGSPNSLKTLISCARGRTRCAFAPALSQYHAQVGD